MIYGINTVLRHVLVACIGLLALIAVRLVDSAPFAGQKAQLAAAQLMHHCTADLPELREASGLPITADTDPNLTGLIGPEYTDFTTTLGSIEAKRTSTNPAFAAVLTRYFLELGLQKGDVIAVGASGSFPAMTLATLCAAKSLELKPLIIYSLGSSMYGAGAWNFTLLEMLEHWRKQGRFSYTVLAVSLGGDEDQAGGLIFEEARDGFVRKAQTCGLPFINEPNLRASEQARMAVYKQAANGQPIRCFVNVGGASVNMGNRGFAARLTNGLVLPETVRGLTGDSTTGASGVAAAFLRQDVPVVHLLDMRHLALKNGLPLDPKPIPPVGEGGVYRVSGHTTLRAILLGLGLCAGLGLLLAGKKDRARSGY